MPWDYLLEMAEGNGAGQAVHGEIKRKPPVDSLVSQCESAQAQQQQQAADAVEHPVNKRLVARFRVERLRLPQANRHRQGIARPEAQVVSPQLRRIEAQMKRRIAAVDFPLRARQVVAAAVFRVAAIAVGNIKPHIVDQRIGNLEYPARRRIRVRPHIEAQPQRGLGITLAQVAGQDLKNAARPHIFQSQFSAVVAQPGEVAGGLDHRRSGIRRKRGLRRCQGREQQQECKYGKAK